MALRAPCNGIQIKGGKYTQCRHSQLSRQGGPSLHGLLVSQVVVARIRHGDYGPAHALARATIEWSSELHRVVPRTGTEGKLHFGAVDPSYLGVEGNEHADTLALKVAEDEEADPGTWERPATRT